MNENGIERKFSYFFDADNSSVIPMQGHKSGLGVLCPEIPDFPIQEAWYKLRYFLRDLQYNSGKFSEEAKEALLDSGIKEEDMLERIKTNLITQEKITASLMPSSDDCFLYRRIAFPEWDVQAMEFKQVLDNLKIGDTKILDYAPIHTTGDIKFMETLSNVIPGGELNLLRIKTPKGSKLTSGKPVKDGITEVIFPSKSEFKFLGKKSPDGLNLWDFEYVLPKN